MLVKGIVQNYPNNENQVKVRIPKYHKLKNASGSTSDDNLPFASICYLPGIQPVYAPNDIVYIEFEDDDISKPVIIGKLLYNNDLINSWSNITAQSLKVNSETRLSKNTKIDDIIYSDLEAVVKGFINFSGGV